MKIYLINAETNEIIQTFDNVIVWGSNFVEFDNNGYRGKVYCGENEYFTDKEVQSDAEKLNEELQNEIFANEQILKEE